MTNNQPVSIDNYKGVRDFYPDELKRRRYIEDVMHVTLRQFGYEEIDASIIEPAELYDAKSGDELAREQSYRFEDRGGRDVMLRPEMTPSVARMLARRQKSLPTPVRWYSVANVFRYEQPQKGRLREHWQLNADIFGINNLLAELEIISITHKLLQNFGAAEDDFIIKISSRALFNAFASDVLGISDTDKRVLATLIDKKNKLDPDSFSEAVADILNTEQVDKLMTYLSIGDVASLRETFSELTESANELEKLQNELLERGIGNAIFEPSLIRGLAYYTGVVFEIFDTSPENNRSLFGGGRYNNLLDMFAVESSPAVGFGAGDVTIADFLDAHKLWPEFLSDIDVDICLLDSEKHATFAYQIADDIQELGLTTRVNISGTAVGTQLSRADNDGALFVIVVGDNEVESGDVTIKELATGEETTVKKAEVVDFFTTTDDEETE
ncbi:MAG: histidine--tRNA ligase [Candidatus Paceibacterota bacterium]